MPNVEFKEGTEAEYNSIIPSDYSFYKTTDTNNVYLGRTKLNNNEAIAESFDTEKDYNKGDWCFYNNKLYIFVVDKEAGAWDLGTVMELNIGQMLAQLTHQLNGYSLVFTDEVPTKETAEDMTIYFIPEEET